ncbi:hypothetical protein PPL_07683 [Heterostelium album PN500]|uniref:Uncharacterized protein n=1 Tax=Heterostelium pallidum (strain ATCC 26659 / Pp 5 / PN500) TaxID=670386 RepID=D3BGN1_HETP5|nr:hypothetical protein PPL_07683 [Heterostelium album PN500]EFA79265.1 hypothetical protein PPL_07683 [Heterostelium album PN500]|eukprot:XP_020431386.1 hypothetical protein PPL_07683 [Heterostelium album PN500]
MSALFPKILFFGNQEQFDALKSHLSGTICIQLIHIDRKHPNQPIPINVLGTHLGVIISLDWFLEIDTTKQFASNQSKILVINFGGSKPVGDPLQPGIKQLKLPGSIQPVSQQISTQAESDDVDNNNNNNNNNNQHKDSRLCQSFKNDFEDWFSHVGSPSTHAECMKTELMIKYIGILDYLYRKSEFARNLSSSDSDVREQCIREIYNHCKRPRNKLNYQTIAKHMDNQLAITIMKIITDPLPQFPLIPPSQNISQESMRADINKAIKELEPTEDHLLVKRENNDIAAIIQLWDCIRQFKGFGVPIDREAKYQLLQEIAIGLSSTEINVRLLENKIGKFLQQLNDLAYITGIPVRCLSDVQWTSPENIYTFNFWVVRQLLKNKQPFIIVNDSYKLANAISDILGMEQQTTEFHRLMGVVYYSTLDSLMDNLAKLEEYFVEWRESKLYSSVKDQLREENRVTRLSYNNDTRWDFYAKLMCLPIDQQYFFFNNIIEVTKSIDAIADSQYSLSPARRRVIFVNLNLNNQIENEIEKFNHCVTTYRSITWVGVISEDVKSGLEGFTKVTLL